MCGFVGFLGGSSHFDAKNSEAILRTMANTIVTRGPDDEGYWYNPENRVGLGHRRLAIIDLSAAGHQPMSSASERYVIAFNGEVYNHHLLRKKLDETDAAPTWRGHSDTETLLAGFDAWGIQATIENSIGMFAFAVWDKKDKVLVLGRDRIGEKPLYYGWQDNVFLFGSELKSIKQHPAFKAELNRDAIALMLRHNYIPTPYSIYQGISKLEPGCLLEVSTRTPDPKVKPYWSAVNMAVAGVNSPFVGTSEQAVDKLEDLAMNAVSQQMMADVPLGAFLSGGVDSSLVVALMQAQSTHPVKTFTIGFYEKAYNEAEHAKAVAQHLGTDHTEVYVTAKEAMDVIPQLPTLYCEPFADSSQIPTYLVSQLAKQHVTVSLSGDAGDELFCGYKRYQITNKMWKKINLFPMPLRMLAAKMLTSISVEAWTHLAHYTPMAERFSYLGDKVHKGAGVLCSRSIDELYLGLVSHHLDPASLLIGSQEPQTLLTANKPELIGLSDIQRMMALDLVSYLPDDVLTKVDRAAMGVSLETRVPFLDHRIVEFAWTLPQSMDLRDKQTKWPLRQLLYKHVPRALIDRPKMGFGIPLHIWLRGPLRDWAESLLDKKRLTQEGIFQVEPIRKLWQEYLSRKHNQTYLLWNILMFQSWFDAQ